MVSKKVLVDFVFDVLADRYTSAYLSQNMSNFTLSDADFKELTKYIEAKNIPVDKKQFTAAKLNIQSDLKVMLYKYHLGDVGFYKAHNQNDPMIKQALNSLQ